MLRGRAVWLALALAPVGTSIGCYDGHTGAGDAVEAGKGDAASRDAGMMAAPGPDAAHRNDASDAAAEATPVDTGAPDAVGADATPADSAADGAGLAEDVEMDAQDSALAPPLPTIEFTSFDDRPQPFAFFESIRVEPDPQGNRITARRRGKCDGGECGQDLPGRYLSPNESAELGSLLQTVPNGNCFGVLPLCDFPLGLWQVVVGDKIHPYTTCMVETCENYLGAIHRVVAMLGRLAASDEAPEEVERCIEPLSSLERAHDDGAVGCACDWPGQSVCVEGTALLCSPIGDSPFTRWRVAAGGPCDYRTCEYEDLEADLSACMQTQIICSPRDDGTYCGSHDYPLTSSLPYQ